MTIAFQSHGYHTANAYLAVAYGTVGDTESAHQAWDRGAALSPGHTLATFSAETLFENPAELERFLEGLRKAGIEE